MAAREWLAEVAARLILKVLTLGKRVDVCCGRLAFRRSSARFVLTSRGAAPEAKELGAGRAEEEDRGGSGGAGSVADKLGFFARSARVPGAGALSAQKL